MEIVDDKRQIEVLSLDEPILRILLTKARRGEISFETAMMSAVFFLTTQKNGLMKLVFGLVAQRTEMEITMDGSGLSDQQKADIEAIVKAALKAGEL